MFSQETFRKECAFRKLLASNVNKVWQSFTARVLLREFHRPIEGRWAIFTDLVENSRTSCSKQANDGSNSGIITMQLNAVRQMNIIQVTIRLCMVNLGELVNISAKFAQEDTPDKHVQNFLNELFELFRTFRIFKQTA